MSKSQEEKKVQVNFNHFRSFCFPIKGVEEKIYNVLCEEFCKYENREKIEAVPLERVYLSLLDEYDKEKAKSQMANGLANLTKTKGGYALIKITPKGIMPTNFFGIVR